MHSQSLCTYHIDEFQYSSGAGGLEWGWSHVEIKYLSIWRARDISHSLCMTIALDTSRAF